MSTYENPVADAIAVLRSYGRFEIANELEEKCFPSSSVMVALSVGEDSKYCKGCTLPVEGGWCTVFGDLRGWDKSNGHSRLKACLEAEIR